MHASDNSFPSDEEVASWHRWPISCLNSSSVSPPKRRCPSEAGDSLPGPGPVPCSRTQGQWLDRERLRSKTEDPDSPMHPEHQEIAEWMGETFDPTVFSAETVNRMLAPPTKAPKQLRR
jgi:hypothetical protein